MLGEELGGLSQGFFFENAPKPCVEGVGTFLLDRDGATFSFMAGLPGDINRFVIERADVDPYRGRLYFMQGDCRYEITIGIWFWYHFDWAPLRLVLMPPLGWRVARYRLLGRDGRHPRTGRFHLMLLACVAALLRRSGDARLDPSPKADRLVSVGAAFEDTTVRKIGHNSRDLVVRSRSFAPRFSRCTRRTCRSKTPGSMTKPTPWSTAHSTVGLICSCACRFSGMAPGSRFSFPQNLSSSGWPRHGNDQNGCRRK